MRSSASWSLRLSACADDTVGLKPDVIASRGETKRNVPEIDVSSPNGLRRNVLSNTDNGLPDDNQRLTDGRVGSVV